MKIRDRVPLYPRASSRTDFFLETGFFLYEKGP
jgi:hypothetical protein